MNKTAYILLFGAVLGPLQSLWCSLLLQENFESLSEGQLSGQDDYIALSEAIVEAGGLSYSSGSIEVPGNVQNLSIRNLAPANNWVFARLFPAQSDAVYFSISISWSSQQVDDFLYLAVSDGIYETSPVALAYSAGIVINGFGSADGTIGGRIRSSSSSFTTQVSSGISAGSNTNNTQLIIGCLRKNNSINFNTLELWINPEEANLMLPDVTVNRDLGISSGLDTIFFFSGASNESNETIRLDNLFVGTALEDVYSPQIPVGSGSDAKADFSSSRLQSADELNDFDHDGRPDILELALGTDPFVCTLSSPFSFLYVTGNVTDIIYLKRLETGEVRYKSLVERSEDLINWTMENIMQEYDSGEELDGRKEVTARINASGEQQFARIRATDERLLSELTFEKTSELFRKLVVYWGSQINAEGTGDTSGTACSYEWVMRMLYPLAGWLSQPDRETTFSFNGQSVDVAEALRKALANGTEPSNGRKWPTPSNQGDQIIVEAPQVGLTAWMLHDAKLRGATGGGVWDSLTSTQLSKVQNFLEVTGAPGFTYTNNWNLFITINQQARKQLNHSGVTEFDSYSQSAIESSLKKIQDMDRGGGWYADSLTMHTFDDYIAYVILPEQMNYFIMGGSETQAETVIPGTNGRGRAEILSDVSNWLKFQIHSFDARGGNPEYGRSSGYKFSRLRPMLLAYYIDRVWNTPDKWNLGFKVLPEEITPGMLRRLVRQHLNHYLGNGAIDPVTYELLKGQSSDSGEEVLESYTHTGSRFWAMNSFAVLFQLQDDDPLWSTPEEKLPFEEMAYENWYETPGFLLRGLPKQGHLELFNAAVVKSGGSDYYNKYSKFTYSSLFGYCTFSGSRIDQSITVGNSYRSNIDTGNYFIPDDLEENQPGVIRTVHSQDGANVRTLIFLRDGAQLRVNRITGAMGKVVREGGYALGHAADETPPSAEMGTDWIYMESSVGAVFTARILGYQSLVQAAGTGNHSRNAKWRLGYGEISPVNESTFYGAMLIKGSSTRFDPEKARALVTSIQINGNSVEVFWSDGSSTAAVFP